MSKSLGNSIAPQDVIKESGADILRLWVSMSDYTRGDPRQQGDPGARRRGVPEDPQHAAVPASRTCTTSIRRPIACRSRQLRGGRPLHPRALRATWRERDPARLRRRTTTATIFQALNAFATVDLSAFYADVSKDRLYTFARAVARAALGADGDVPDGRRPDAPARADPVVHGRRAVALPARRARGVGAPGAVSRPRPSSTRSPIRRCVERWDSAGRRSASGCSPRSSRCARTSRSAARCRRKVVLSAPPAELRAARALRDAPADAVHRVRGRAAAGAATSGAADASRHHDRARRRREVRALLAVSCRRSRPSRPGPASAPAARTRWPRRSMADAVERVADAGARRRRRAPRALAAAGDRRRSIRRRRRSSARRLPLHDSVTVIPGFLDFTHVRNTRRRVRHPERAPTSRSRRSSSRSSRRRRSSASALYAASLAHHQLVARIGLALIIGGAAGNLIDRVLAGSVVDFVDVYWRTLPFLGVQRRRLGDYGRRRDA